MTLSLYIARRFVLTFLMVLGVFYALLFMVDMIEQMRRHAGSAEGLRPQYPQAGCGYRDSIGNGQP